MKKLPLLFILLLVVHIGMVLYANRALFTSKFDPVYWKDKYEHSQWKLPLSVRTLGDDGLYLYEGYRIARGADPTLLNAEVPPLGKYLIGASVIFFGNGYVYGLIITSTAIIAVYLLALALGGNRTTALAAATLTALDPLITNQMTLTMLDSLQVVFLLLYLLFLTLLPRAKQDKSKIVLVICTGIALGFFSETKFPLFSPIIAVIGAISIWHTTKKLGLIILMIASAAISYLIPYIPYFLLGHTLFDFLRVQKWIVSFYLHSNLAPTFGSALATLFTGFHQNLYSRVWERVGEWSIAWPVVTIMGSIGLLRFARAKKNHGSWFMFTAIVFFFLIFYSVIPFWSRYLLLLLPLFYIATALSITKGKYLVVLMALIVVNGLSSLRILFPTPETTVKQFIYEWERGFFHDMYERMAKGSTSLSRTEFHHFGLQTLADGQIEVVTITPSPVAWSAWNDTQEVPVDITYYTRNLGLFSQKTALPVVKEDGQWRINWNWNLLAQGLDETKRLETTVIEARRGSIIMPNKTYIGKDVDSVMIWVTPKDVDTKKEEEMLKYLEELFIRKISAPQFHQRYAGNTLSNSAIPLGVPPYELSPEQLNTLDSFPGISFTEKLGRFNQPAIIFETGHITNTNFFECCSLLYSAANYNGVEGLEEKFNATLKGQNGGSLVIKDADGTIVRTILSSEKKDGKDMQL